MGEVEFLQKIWIPLYQNEYLFISFYYMNVAYSIWWFLTVIYKKEDKRLPRLDYI